MEREGKRHDLKVVVADLANIFPEQYGNGSEDSAKSGVEPTSVKFGMQIQTLTEQQRPGAARADVDTEYRNGRSP